MKSAFQRAAAVSLLLLAACGGGAEGPAPLDTANEACAWCRMAVSDRRFAAQLTAPGHEPKFFDDAGCLRDWLKEPRESAPWSAWVSDHLTKEWVKAADAVFVLDAAVQTPMSSGLVAWASAASREKDPAGKGGTPIPAADVIGPFPAATK